MPTEKLFRRQAATCATMAKETHDEESRERCIRLEQTYLHLAEIEEQIVAPTVAASGQNEKRA
jgi:hypothetical protein